MKIIAGVYRIIVENKSYVGSSINVYRRWSQHKRSLNAGTNDNKTMQLAFNRCRKAEFELLEQVVDADAAVLTDRENYYINKYHPEYNAIPARKNACSKTIYQFDLHGNFITSYSSVDIAASVIGVSPSSIMHAAQENETHTRTVAGYFWKYTPTISITKDARLHNLYVYNLSGEYLTSFESVKEAKTILFSNDKGDHGSRINRVARGLACSYNGYRFSYKKEKKLDNSKLLSVKCWFPVVQISPDKKTRVAIYETASIAAKALGVHSSSEITVAIAKGTKCRGYYWTRLGTKWSELLEYPEGVETETESETINGKV